jgi:hypothetical protein
VRAARTAEQGLLRETAGWGGEYGVDKVIRGGIVTKEDADALEQFINDHDTRFQAKAMTGDPECYVLLTRPEDGTQLDLIYHVAEYGTQHIEPSDPGPTILHAWERWTSARSE